MNVFLTDDASTDGTAIAIRHNYPEVRILPGTGDLFWNRGMHLAFGEAIRQAFDFYLWLNDDVQLYSSSISKLLDTAMQFESKAVVVGSLRDPRTGKLTYGGVRRSSSWNPLRFRTVQPAQFPILVDTMNGNCVLIPRRVVDAIGNLDPIFIHTMGDYDYGLRAKKYGFSIILAPSFFGECARNPVDGSWQDENLPLPKLLKQLTGPKGLPVKSWLIFSLRHGGLFGLLVAISTYPKMVAGSIIYRYLH